MRTAAVISEFLADDDRRESQIEDLRREAGADFVIAAMSGDYLQCGLPAAEPGQIRAQRALRAGVDAVVEIPVFTALTGLDTYVPSAIALLDKLHCVDVIGIPFGVPDRALTEKITFFLFAESREFQNEVKRYRSRGLSYYDAQAKAIGRQFEGTEEWMRKPVNYMAFECLKSLKRMYSSLRPCFLPEDFWQRGDLFGGTGERTPDAPRADREPRSAGEAFRLSLGRAQKLFPLIRYEILLIREKMDQIYGGSTLFSRFILDHIGDCADYSRFAELCANADRTAEDVNRFLFHVLLGIGKSDIAVSRMYDSAPYARILARKEEARPFLEEAEKKSRIPVITDSRTAGSRMDAARRELFAIDLRASAIYGLSDATGFK